MGLPSEPASNGIIYTTYALFLVFGLAVGWRFRKSKGDYLSALRTQTCLSSLWTLCDRYLIGLSIQLFHSP